MVTLLTQQIIAAPPQAVWDIISDIDRYPEWVIGTKKIVSASGLPMGVGTEYTELTQIGPSVSESTWRITRFEAPFVQVHESHSAILSARLVMTLKPEGSGTLFLHEIETSLLPGLPPLGWLLERLLSRSVARDMRNSLQLAQQIAEREAKAEV